MISILIERQLSPDRLEVCAAIGEDSDFVPFIEEVILFLHDNSCRGFVVTQLRCLAGKLLPYLSYPLLVGLMTSLKQIVNSLERFDHGKAQMSRLV